MEAYLLVQKIRSVDYLAESSFHGKIREHLRCKFFLMIIKNLE